MNLRGARERFRSGWIVPAALAILLMPAREPAAAAPASRPFRVKTLDGAVLDLEDLRRRGPVLIDFWSTWCKPCLHSLPAIEALHREFSPLGLAVVGVSIDGPRNHSKVRPFAARMGLTYPIVLDEDGSLQQRFQVRAVPTVVLVDTAGAVVHIAQGFRPGEEELLRARIHTLCTAPAGEGDQRP